jgi:ribonuclease HI
VGAQPAAKWRPTSSGLGETRRPYRRPCNSSGFSPPRGGAPACLSSVLLLLAGDVEQNPGPQPMWPCSMCDREIRGSAIYCSRCERWVHRRCTLLSSREYYAACQANRRGGGRAYSCPRHAPGNDVERGGESDCRLRGLRLLQWNAGGLSSAKLGELRRFLEGAVPPVDIVAVQETHLQPGRTIKLPGYDILRTDRARGRRDDVRVAGGGLLIAVRAGIMHRQQPAPPPSRDSVTEVLSVDILSRGGRRPTLRVVNVYAPPIRGDARDERPSSLGLERLSVDDRTVVCADANAHHTAWDRAQPTDAAGHELDDWAVTCGLVALNTTEATRVNPATGGLSSPDVTLAPASLERRCEWRVCGSTMGSDHFPIDIRVGGCRVRIDRGRRSSPKPSWKRADWARFGRVLDAELAARPGPFPTAAAASAAFTDALQTAVSKSVPISHRQHPKWWWTEECSRAVDERRRLRRIATATRNPTDLERWREARRHVREATATARRTAWRDYTSHLNARSDPSAVWKTIRSLDGRTSRGNQFGAMTRGSRECASSGEKARLFVDAYAGVSRLPHDREDKDVRRGVYARLRQPCGCEDHQVGPCQPFSLPELNRALSRLKPNKAAGPDGIATDPLRHLTVYARARLLELANLSWLSGEVPTTWRRGVIVPILKPGKPGEEVESYRPISLTSNVAKVIERLVAARLLDLIERRGILSRVQAGFRPGRCAEDQVLRLAESVCARFEHQRDKRTTLALVDFSRAFDKVWHIGLAHKLLRAGIPNCYVWWIRQFLSDRRACVRLNGVCSRQRVFRTGVPQGAVLSPLLFLVYIDDIVDNMPRDVDVSLYADDIALWASGPTINAASRKVQAALLVVEQWARRWKLPINPGKSETAAFALGCNAEALVSPTLELNGETLRSTATPKLLGVTFDRRMTFRTHVDRIAERMTARLQQLRRLAGRSWGCCARDLRAVYLAYIRSVADYCGACYLPAASESTVRRLEVLQRQAARVITGCVASTPVGALEREANLMPLRLRGAQLAGCAYVRAVTKPVDEPLHRLIADRQNVQRRLKVQRSWLPRGAEFVSDVGLKIRNVRSRPGILALPPWERWPDLDVRPELAHRPADITPESRRVAAERTLADLLPVDVLVWTDGSVHGDQTDGGGGFVIDCDGGEGVAGRVAAGRHASSYATELTAILAAGRHLLRRPTAPGSDDQRRLRMLLCTDSRSALQAIAMGPTTRADSLFAAVWRTLSALSRRYRVTLQWVPAHCGVAGNEAADVQAASASRLDQRRAPIAYDAALAAVRRTARRRWLEGPQPDWHRRAAGPLPICLDGGDLSRADAVTVAQLRTGHSVLLASYRHRVGLATSPLCPDCGFDDPDTAEHFLLHCPAHHRLRDLLFNSSSNPSFFFARPSDVADFVRRAGRMRPRF